MINRNLAQYRNANGKTPSGQDTQADDTTAVQQALNAGPGIVQVGPGFYRWSGVTVPSGVMLVGSGPATVVRSSGGKCIFSQTGVRDWAIRDLVLDGETTGKWEKRRDRGQSGIICASCLAYDISHVTVRNFRGAGIQLTRTGTPTGDPGFGSLANLDSVTAIDNYIGIRFDIRAEYINASKLSCRQNVIGCVIHAGNVKITGSNFTSNIDGILISDKENGSHGAISNCLINHNVRCSLAGRGVFNGMAIDNCCFFYGMIRLRNCTGVNITSGMFGCSLEIVGGGANRIAGNYVIDEGETYKFSRRCIIQGNFTKAGLWARNNH